MSADADVFREHERFLWGLCYRMTGSAADADDLVQDTFAKAIEQPPPDQTLPWRPWLVRVAVNLARDVLRRRKRRGYEGIWLPAPIETGGEEAPPSVTPAEEGAAWRYDQLESVSYAFLLALEALTPRQRAVLLLRDVFDYSVRETAEALDLGEPNVKTTHHRARRAMAAYDGARCLPTRDLQQRTRRALERFLTTLVSGDVAAVESLLASDARVLGDGGGQYHAAGVPVVGAAKVALFYTNLSRGRADAPLHFELRELNGLPALVAQYGTDTPRQPPRFVLRCEIDDRGLITRIFSVLAPNKLTGVRFWG